MDLREQKGRVIAQTRTIKKMDDGYAVQSQNSERFYFVDKQGVCTCPDCQKGSTDKCKHAFAVQYYLQKITTQRDGSVKVENKRLTYPQAWSAYNKSQTSEKEQFLKLLKDLTNTEQEANFGRPKANIGEMAFCCALKVYTQFSTRRANTDIKEAFEKGLISKTHHYNTIIKYFNEPELTPLLESLIAESSAPLKSVETSFAVDSTGFRTTKFNDYCKEKHDTKKAHQWVKLHAVCGTKTNTITSCQVSENNSGDSLYFAPLIQQTADNGFSLQEVSADKAYSSRANYDTVKELGGKAYIPFRSNASGNSKGSQTWKKMFHYFQFNKEEFGQFYHKRSNIETSFYSLKAKFNDCLKSRKPIAQKNELLLKVLCYNIVCLIHEVNELGISLDFRS
ncbi:MAG: transposase [Candidatus Diapherotrites archaeon]|nr:transposase [Candidatus Diapherotrites archaeon]